MSRAMSVKTGDAEREAPFVETRAGGLFFFNAVLTGPAILVLWPVLLRALLRGAGALRGPSPLLDPVPAVAAQIGPYVAWLSVIPLWSIARNLRMELPTAARATLYALALVNIGVLAWWVWALAR
jgi:hypothetical protein